MGGLQHVERIADETRPGRWARQAAVVVIVALAGMAVMAGMVGGAGTAAATPPAATDATDTTIGASTSSADDVVLVLDPATLDFGRVPPDGRATIDVRVSNVASDEVTVIDASIVGDDAFAVSDDGCTGRTLVPDDSCILTVVFTPGDEADHAGSLAVAYAGPAGSGGVTAAMSGSTGSSSSTAPPITVPPSSVVPTSPDTSPATSVVPPDQAELEARLAQCEAEAEDAMVRYAPQLEMTVGEETAVDVEASIEGAGGIPDTTTGAPPTTVVSARLSCFVVATLIGSSSDFEIEDPEKSGSFLEEPEITWSWDVRPLTAGTHDLDLEITPRVRDIRSGLLEDGNARRFQADITVLAVQRSAWERFSDWLGDVIDHPLVRGVGPIAALLAAVAALWRWVLRKPWPWARAVIAGDDPDDDEQDDDSTPGYL